MIHQRKISKAAWQKGGDSYTSNTLLDYLISSFTLYYGVLAVGLQKLVIYFNMLGAQTMGNKYGKA